MTTQHALASLIQALGGAENISRIHHCMTRVRLQLQHPKQADEAQLRTHPLIKAVVIRGDEWQLISHRPPNELAAQLTQYLRPKIDILARFSSAYTPLIPLFFFCAWLTAIGQYFPLFAPETTYLTSLFYQQVLPLLLAFLLANAFNANAVFATLLAALIAYSSPTEHLTLGIISTTCLSIILEKYSRHLLPAITHIYLMPLLLMAILYFPLLHGIMPAAEWLSVQIVQLIYHLLSSPLSYAVLAGSFLPLLQRGLHPILLPIYLILFEQQQQNPLFTLFALSGMAQIGVTLATQPRSNKALLAALFGRGEALLYQTIQPEKINRYLVSLAAAIGAVILFYFDPNSAVNAPLVPSGILIFLTFTQISALKAYAIAALSTIIIGIILRYFTHHRGKPS